MLSFPLISHSCHLYNCFSSSSLFPCTFLPFWSCIFSHSMGFMTSFLFSFCSYTFHNLYLSWQLATCCLRKYFPKDSSFPPRQRKHFHGYKSYYLNRKKDIIAKFQYLSKNSQKKEMLIQIIPICHFWIKLSSIKKKTQFNNLKCFSKIQP